MFEVLEMKKTLHGFFTCYLTCCIVVCCSALCSSCSENDSQQLAPTMTLREATEITGSTAVLGATVEERGGNVTSSVFAVSPNEDFQNGTKEVAMEPLKGFGSALIQGLTPYTKYFYRLRVKGSYSTVTSDTKQFTTLYIEKPYITSFEKTSQNGNSVTMKIKLQRGVLATTDFGVTYKSDYDTDSTVQHIAVGDSDEYIVTIKNLHPCTTYANMKAFVTCEKGTAESEPLSVVTDNTVYLDSAGALKNVIAEGQKYGITTLKIVGDFNGTDMNLIDDMAGSDVNYTPTAGQLAELDLSEANIRAGGEKVRFNESFWNTKDNFLPGAFMSNSPKLKKVTIPASVTEIEGGSMNGLDHLADVEVPEASAYFKSVDGVLFTKDITMLVGFPPQKQCASYAVPEGVTTLGMYSLCGASKVDKITFPSTLKSIGELAFYMFQHIGNPDCELIIPASVTSIGDQAFMKVAVKTIKIYAQVKELPSGAMYKCSNLQSLTLGSTIKTIQPVALNNLPSMKELHILSTTPPTLLNDTQYPDNPNLGGINKGSCLLYVPKGTADSYKAASGWQDFDHIVEE
jgi:hypothetical protein